MTRREEGNKDFLRAIDNSVYLERETRVVCVWFGWTGKGGRLLLGPSSLRTREFLSRAGVMVCVCGESGSGVRRGINKVVACRWWKSEPSRDVGAHSETLAVGL